MIRFAQDGDHPALKALWSEIFGDAMESVDAYFALRHRNENMLVDAQDHVIAGMLSMLPFTLQSGDRRFSARYVYAVATHPTCRNQGVSTRLMEAAHEMMQSRGEEASVLVPASPGLFDFYGKRGYKTEFLLDVVRFDAGQLPLFPKDGRFSPCSPREYARLRDKAFSSSRLYARWEESAVSYAMKTFGPQGGVTHLYAGGREGCAAWERQDHTVLVRELALCGLDAATALAILHRELNATSYQVRLPEGSHPGGQTLPFGMIRWLIPEPDLHGEAPYFSLALD